MSLEKLTPFPAFPKTTFGSGIVPEPTRPAVQAENPASSIPAPAAPMQTAQQPSADEEVIELQPERLTGNAYRKFYAVTAQMSLPQPVRRRDSTLNGHNLPSSFKATLMRQFLGFAMVAATTIGITLLVVFLINRPDSSELRSGSALQSPAPRPAVPTGTNSNPATKIDPSILRIESFQD